MKALPFACVIVSMAAISCGGGSNRTGAPSPDASGAFMDASQSSPDTWAPVDVAAVVQSDGSSSGITPTDSLPSLPDAFLVMDLVPIPDAGLSPDAPPVVDTAATISADARDSKQPDLSTPGADTATANALPRFVDSPDAGNSNPFLISLAHLYGGTIAGVPLHAISNVNVSNPGNTPADVIVTGQLQSYSAPASVGLHVDANRTAPTGPIDLTFDFDALYAISAPVFASVSLQLTPAGSTGLLDAHTRTIQILPKNTIFWSMTDGAGNLVNTAPFIAAFVTPHDKNDAINQLLKEAASYSRCNAMVGYQTGCMNTPVYWSPSTATTAPGFCSTWKLTATAGTVFDISVKTTCASLCTSSNAQFGVFTETDWQGARESPLKAVEDLGSWAGRFLAPADGTYVLAACNPSSNFADRSFTLTIAGNP